ncbi:MAG: DUF5050 domain-containing protein [Ruminococcaceae bacterium]|nr:DUF5050 domain-containing protein [Oscillospiraceae bacterium]
MKHDYFENDGADAKRSKRTKKKKERKALKGFIIFVSALVVAAVVFVVTVKVLAPDFDFMSLVPQSVQSVFEKQTNSSTQANTVSATDGTTELTTEEKPTEKMIDYIEFKEFKMETSKQGNSMGNLLNGGKVATDYSYIYHIADSGLYRLAPETEDYTRLYKTSHSLSSLNLRGDYIYFVDDDTNELYKMKKGSSSPKSVAQNVKFAYVYDSNIYYVTVTNDLCIMDAKVLKPSTVYSAADDELRLVGVSLNRVYFAVNYGTSVDYYTMANEGDELPSPFRASETTDSKLVMENGFMYFYAANSNGKYDVCRKKFGSSETVTLANDADGSNFISVSNNRLYYSELAGSSFRMTEINMNSKKSRYLIAVGGVNANHTLSIFDGGDYDFIIGNTGSKEVYNAGCIYTGSTNYMKFSSSGWEY